MTEDKQITLSKKEYHSNLAALWVFLTVVFVFRREIDIAAAGITLILVVMCVRHIFLANKR